MRPIVQLHEETHWREAVMIDGKWYVAVDGAMQPVTREFVKTWAYLHDTPESALVVKDVGWKPLFRAQLGVTKAGAA